MPGDLFESFRILRRFAVEESGQARQDFRRDAIFYSAWLAQARSSHLRVMGPG